MKIGIPKEVHTNERRVACTPAETLKLAKLGYEVSVEAGAGIESGFSDSEFESSGARIVSNAAELWKESDIICKVRAPEQHPRLPPERPPSPATTPEAALRE